MTNFCWSRCSPGKSPSRVSHCSQARWWRQLALLGHVPIMMVTRLPSFNPIGPMPTAADPPLALGPAARPLREVLDLF